MADRLNQALGAVPHDDYDGLARRMSMPWLFHVGPNNASEDATEVVDDAGKARLQPLPAARRRKGLTALGGYFDSMLSILQRVEGGITREDFIDHLRAERPENKDASHGMAINMTQTEDEAIEAAAQARAAKTGGDVEAIKRSMINAMQGDTDLDVKRSANGSIQGFFDPQTGQSFLIADNLTTEAAPGVLMHEVGIHMAADGSMKALFNRAAMMLKMQRGNPFIKAVQARMDAAGETSGEEAAAYIAEAYENDRANAPASVQRWLADLLAAVKAWMFKKGIMGADRLTVADIAAVARANARSMARDGGATGGQGFGPAFSVGEEVGAKALAEFAKADEEGNPAPDRATALDFEQGAAECRVDRTVRPDGRVIVRIRHRPVR